MNVPLWAMIPYSLKKAIKKMSLTFGVYPMARRINDRLTRRRYLESFESDISFFRSVLPKGALCYDIGANIGEKTEALLRAGMRVVSVEPQPLCVEELRARCSRYDLLEVCEMAIGAEIGEAELFISDIFHASSSLDKDWGPSHESIKVKMTTLDALIREFGKPYYCKVDVEGYEANVFRGLSQAIPLVSFEYHLTDRDIGKTFECIELISSKAERDVLINISPAEHFGFTFSQWMSIDSFKKQFPNSIAENREFYYGDIWIKSI